MILILTIAIELLGSDELVMKRGRLSMYYPGDGYTGRVMACDTPKKRRIYREGSVHIALRKWWKIGCGKKVVVCSEITRKCATAPVLDAGPFGIYRGELRGAKREGRWKVWTKSKPPEGWQWRAVADLSRALWKKLGKPPGLSMIRIYRSDR